MARRVVHLRPRAPGGVSADAPLTTVPTAPAVAPAAKSPRRPRARVKTAGADATPPAETASRAARAKRATRQPGRDAFAERLRALELEIEEALAQAGAPVDQGTLPLLRVAGEELLRVSADLGRAFAAGGLEGAFIHLRMLGTADRVDDFGYDAAFHARVEPLLRVLYERWWRVETSGIEHVPLAGRVLLVANHSGGMLPYDGFMIREALRAHHPSAGRHARPLIEDFVYHFPVLGPLLAALGAVRASAENAERLLAREQAIVVFPEGAKGLGKYYRERYRLQRFARGGFVALALRTASPIVPVAVIGAEEIHPVLAKWQWAARALDLPYFPVTPTFPWLGLLGLIPLPTKWRLHFGPPIDVAAEYGTQAWEDELLVNRLKEQVRERIQRMVVSGLRERDSVFS